MKNVNSLRNAMEKSIPTLTLHGLWKVSSDEGVTPVYITAIGFYPEILVP